MILLLTDPFFKVVLCAPNFKVHIVFDSEHLMKRDLNEFGRWFTSNNISVEFHVGLDFEISNPKDIILIDEADEIILFDPANF